MIVIAAIILEGFTVLFLNISLYPQLFYNQHIQSIEAVCTDSIVLGFFGSILLMAASIIKYLQSKQSIYSIYFMVYSANLIFSSILLLLQGRFFNKTNQRHRMINVWVSLIIIFVIIFAILNNQYLSFQLDIIYVLQYEYLFVLLVKYYAQFGYIQRKRSSKHWTPWNHVLNIIAISLYIALILLNTQQDLVSLIFQLSFVGVSILLDAISIIMIVIWQPKRLYGNNLLYQECQAPIKITPLDNSIQSE